MPLTKESVVLFKWTVMLSSAQYSTTTHSSVQCYTTRPPLWPRGEGVRLESEEHGDRTPLHPVESYQSLQNSHSSGYPARPMALEG